MARLTMSAPRIAMGMALGSVTSRRSLQSRQSVLKDSGFNPIKGRVYDVHSGRFLLAMDAVFPQYLDLIFDAKDPK